MSDDDPFEEFDAPEDDSDPFADLDDDAADDEPGRMTDDPFTEDDGEPETAEPETDAGESAIPAGEADDPFTSFSTPGSGGESEADDPFSAFESPDIDEIDPDKVWQTLSDLEADDMPEFEEDVYYEVSKHQFCENCEYFSKPPNATCTYSGAAIVEFLDMETVRLLNCPIVAEKRQLEENVGNID